MPAERSDRQILILATVSVIVAGLMVAAVLLFASGRGGSPRKYVPFAAGSAAALRNELRDGGPFYFPDPFGKDRSILFALEDGKIVALSSTLPGTTSCAVKWRGSINRFVDCHDDRLVSTDLDRYAVEIPPTGASKGLLLVDLRKRIPAPG